MADDFPAEVKQFIGQHIESLAQLEVLLFARQNAHRAVHPNEVANRLALNAETSTSLLADLVRRGLAIRADPCYRYQARNEEMDRAVGLLAELYHARRLAVTNEIYSKPLDKVKSFAEAFKFRKEE